MNQTVSHTLRQTSHGTYIVGISIDSTCVYSTETNTRAEAIAIRDDQLARILKNLETRRVADSAPELLAMLARVCNAATRPNKTDSCGHAMVSMRAELINQARELVARINGGAA